MSKMNRTGAIAAAAMICLTLLGAQATGASAEAATEVAPPPAAVEPAVEDAPRFYAEEVAQPLRPRRR